MTAGDLLRLPELQGLREKSGRRGAGLVLHAWTVIAATTLLYAAWPSALTLLVAVVVIGGRQLGLAVLMHEASHWLLFPGQSANNRVGRWLCAAPIGADLAVSHALLLAKGHGPRMDVAPGYLDVLRRALVASAG